MRNVERAKKIAADKGINISFVCREIGKSRGYISQMLTTDRDFPDELLLPVANALGVTVEELTGEKENPASVYTGVEVDTAKMLADLDNLSTKKPTAQGDELTKEDVEEWIKTEATDEELIQFIAAASAKLVKK